VIDAKLIFKAYRDHSRSLPHEIKKVKQKSVSIIAVHKLKAMEASTPEALRQ
jgi:hypothetical protein